MQCVPFLVFSHASNPSNYCVEHHYVYYVRMLKLAFSSDQGYVEEEPHKCCDEESLSPSVITFAV